VTFQYVPVDICIVISDKSPEAILTYMHLHDVEWETIDSEPPRIVSTWFRTPLPLELTWNVNVWCDMKNTHVTHCVYILKLSITIFCWDPRELISIGNNMNKKIYENITVFQI
jgi:hypothetical protein